jgi:SAM-dependent methyltransferase
LVGEVHVADQTHHIAEDEFLSTFYRCAYGHLAATIGTKHESCEIVEIGSGLGLAQLSGHSWWHSDVLPSDALNLRNSAEHLPFRDRSIDALILKDTWHHIPDIEAFLGEAHRVLRVGGTIAVFDPYWGILARFVYRFLHQERWDTRAREWSFRSTDPWDSNQALTYMMLRRDRQDFNRRWGNRFTLTEYGRHVGPSFLLSGGVSRRTPVSGKWLKRLLIWEERQGSWFDHFRFFHVFGLVKQ